MSCYQITGWHILWLFSSGENFFMKSESSYLVFAHVLFCSLISCLERVYMRSLPWLHLSGSDPFFFLPFYSCPWPGHIIFTELWVRTRVSVRNASVRGYREIREFFFSCLGLKTFSWGLFLKRFWRDFWKGFEEILKRFWRDFFKGFEKG